MVAASKLAKALRDLEIGPMTTKLNAVEWRTIRVGAVHRLLWSGHSSSRSVTTEESFAGLMCDHGTGFEVGKICCWAVFKPFEGEVKVGKSKRTVPGVDQHLFISGWLPLGAGSGGCP